MKTVYFDSAATTAIDAEVKEAMIAAMDSYGNPSSTHNIGRKSKIIIERVRKNIATELNCLPGELFFTSGGTEADNMAIHCAVRDLGVTRIISSPIEHHAVGHTAEFLRDNKNVELVYLNVDEFGQVDLEQLESELKLVKGGLRYSWGFPSCPDVSQHHLVWKLLHPEKSGMSLTESGQIIPEQSTAAIVLHHPNAQYFVI